LICIMTSQKPSLLQYWPPLAKAKTAPFVIVSTSRTQAKVIHKHCLAACPDVVIKKYNSDSSAADHKDFDDVNKSWANVDILIYTSAISTDCSLELPHFT